VRAPITVGLSESARTRTPTGAPRAGSTTGAPLSADPNALAFAKVAGEALARADAKVQEAAARSAAAEEARAYAARVKAAAAAKRRGSQPELAGRSGDTAAAPAEAPVARPSAPAHELVRELVSDAVPTPTGGALSANALIAAAGTAQDKSAPVRAPRLLDDTAAFEPVEPTAAQDGNIGADHVVVRPSIAEIQQVAATIAGATDVAVQASPTAAGASGPVPQPLVSTQPVSASQVLGSLPVSSGIAEAQPVGASQPMPVAQPEPVATEPVVAARDSSQSVTAPVRPIDEGAETTPFLRADPEDVRSELGQPITVSESPTTTVAVADIVTVTGAADTAIVTASPRVVITETPAHDGPPVKQATGEIGARPKRETKEPPAPQPSVLVDEVSTVQSDLAAVHAAAAAARAKAPSTPPPPSDAATASRELEVSGVRRDAAAFSADEEAFFNRAESQTYAAPKVESFDDLDEGYEPPPSFWERVWGKKKKK
jgi:hypothetical protein